MNLPLLLALFWNWVPNGPVYFEIWSSTNLVTWTLKTNVPCSPWRITPGPVVQFFLVRAVRTWTEQGQWQTNYGDWGTK